MAVNRDSDTESFVTVYSARIRYDEASVKRSAIVQYNTYNFGKKLLTIAMGMLMVVLGVVLMGSGTLGLVCIAVGCFMITGSNSRPNSLARSILKQLNGSFPSLNYFFGEIGMKHSNSGDQAVPYSDFDRLVEDEDYLYLFLGNKSSFMIERDSVKGPDDCEGLKTYITEKTGREWSRPLSGRNLTLQKAISMARANRKNTADEGERLKDRRY